MRRLFPAFLALCVSVLPLGAAISAPGSAHVSFAELEQFRASGVPDDRWPAMMETLGSEEQRAAVRGIIREVKPFPARKLVELLRHPRLAVRLGALEILEEAAGDAFDFDAWQDVQAEGANAEAWKRWQDWAEKGSAPTAGEGARLTDETFRVIVRELTGEQPDRAEQAMRRLAGYGMTAIAPLEVFLQSQGDLEGRPRAMLKQAQYRLVLSQTIPLQANALARDLATGTPEAQSTAIGALGRGGVGVLPILNDFLDSPDPLVREAAVDAAFEAGGSDAIPMVRRRIADEAAESVLHAMLRGVGKFGSIQEDADALLRFLAHPSENVVVAALEALGLIKAGSPETALKKALEDSRWRVRAAALEAIGKRGLSSCKDQVAAKLSDPEVFVRVTAVQTFFRIARSAAEAVLVAEFEKQDELKATILASFLQYQEGRAPARMWEVLQKAPPDVILQCLDTLDDRDDRQGKRVVHAVQFARHPNRDVSAAALRILAGHGRETVLLLEALQGTDEEKKDAVLDQLRLPPGFLGEARNAAMPSPPPAGVAANPKLDLLYAKLNAISPSGGNAAAAVVTPGEADPAAIRAFLDRTLKEGSPRQKLRAALTLAPTGDAAALTYLSSAVETLNAVERRSVAASLASVPDWKAVSPLALRLLRDPADDVREEAMRGWSSGGDPERLVGLLSEMARAESLLSPSEVLDWEFARVLQSKRGSGGTLIEWCRRALTDDAIRDAVRVLAIIILQSTGNVSEDEIAPLTRAQNPIVRRAAYRALGLRYAVAHLERLTRDDSALVRGVLAALAAPANGVWTHYFDDATQVDDFEDYHSMRRERTFGAWAGNGESGGKVPDEAIAALESQARDPASRVRFEALFALLRLGRAIDPAAFAKLVARQPQDVEARSRLGNFLEQEYARLGKGYAVLLPQTEQVSAENYARMQAHFGIAREEAITSFAALSKVRPIAPSAVDNAIAEVAAPAAKAPTAPYRVLFFHKVGCRDCERVREMLARHAAAFPRARIEEHDIDLPDVALLNETLSSRFRVNETLHQVTPAVFTQAGALVRDQLTFPALGDLLRSTESVEGNDAWARIEVADAAVAEQKIAERYDAMSLGVVGLAGLLDGINPCAFATIIFLLSYLHVARRTPREVLAVGVAFISAVFLSYFIVGLGLVHVVTKLDAMRVAGTVLNYVLAGVALVLAIFSFRDAQLASRGQMGEMTLQLPGVLKEQIRTAIRTSSKARRFVVAAFVAGVVISMLELACTGQVYLPTILYMVRAGRSEAMGHLLLYNTAFVLPLVVVFGLAWAGMRSDALIRFQQKHVTVVKVLTGILFLFLTAFLLFGHLVIPELRGKP